MHKRFLLVALEKAWQGRGQCSPNPAVGAVLVHKGKIIASAFHQYAGGPHAEQYLLTDQGQFIPPHSTLYVTLEPCNHWGKTPPCVDWIVKRRIERVVFAYRDVNPVVSQHDTPSILRSHGIEVIHEPLDEIDAFYKSYNSWNQTKKPWVTAKIAQSLDGKIASPTGLPIKISNETCAKLTHRLRRYCDIILTTAKTIKVDNPRLNARFEHEKIAKNIAILDRALILKGDEAVFKHAKQVHIFYEQALKHDNIVANCFYHPVAKDDKGLNLNDVFEKLGELGYHDLFVEAGGQLFSALHHANLVNTTYFYIAPCIMGSSAPNACYEGEWFGRPHQLTWLPHDDNMVMQIEWACSKGRSLDIEFGV